MIEDTPDGHLDICVCRERCHRVLSLPEAPGAAACCAGAAPALNEEPLSFQAPARGADKAFHSFNH